MTSATAYCMTFPRRYPKRIGLGHSGQLNKRAVVPNRSLVLQAFLTLVLIFFGTADVVSAEPMDCAEFYRAVEQKSQLIEQGEGQLDDFLGKLLEGPIPDRAPAQCELAKSLVNLSDEIDRLAKDNKARCEQKGSTGEYNLHAGFHAGAEIAREFLKLDFCN